MEWSNWRGDILNVFIPQISFNVDGSNRLYTLQLFVFWLLFSIKLVLEEIFRFNSIFDIEGDMNLSDEDTLSSLGGNILGSALSISQKEWLMSGEYFLHWSVVFLVLLPCCTKPWVSGGRGFQIVLSGEDYKSKLAKSLQENLSVLLKWMLILWDSFWIEDWLKLNTGVFLEE